MSLNIGILYHWSPKDRRLGVLQSGLVIMKRAQTNSVPFPWVCLATTPSCAWGLTLAEDRMDHEIWDLWQVALSEHDHVEYLSSWGPLIQEVRVHNSVAADRVWWVGERDCHVGIALQRNKNRSKR